jgi:nucleoid DNA-binding protein
MKIGRYIYALLQEHESVVLPGLGTFIAQVKSSGFSGENILAPPSMVVRFVPEVRINDGLLLNYISHKQGINSPKAHVELLKICDEIQYRLDHNETVGLDGLGRLSRKDGFLFFESNDLPEVHPGSYGLEPVLLPIPVNEKPQSEEKPVSVVRSERVKHTGKSLYWLFLIPVLVIPVVVFLLARQQENKEINEPEQAVAVPADIADSHPGYSDTLSARTDTVLIEQEVMAHHPIKGMYYLIGGSFKTRANADKYAEKMTAQGYEPIHLGEIGNFHVVAVGVFNDMREAARAQNNMLKDNPDTDMWVYNYQGKE